MLRHVKILLVAFSVHVHFNRLQYAAQWTKGVNGLVAADTYVNGR